MDDAIRVAILAQLEALITQLAPDANLRAMYGGIVIELREDDTKSRIGGYYTYPEYVSLELAKGVSFTDQEGHLEGSGKLRRHVKLRQPADIVAKNCAGFLRQAIALS